MRTKISNDKLVFYVSIWLTTSLPLRQFTKFCEINYSTLWYAIHERKAIIGDVYYNKCRERLMSCRGGRELSREYPRYRCRK